MSAAVKAATRAAVASAAGRTLHTWFTRREINLISPQITRVLTRNMTCKRDRGRVLARALREGSTCVTNVISTAAAADASERASVLHKWANFKSR